MELRQELKMHFADMKLFWKSAKYSKSKLPSFVIWMLFFSAITYVVGYTNGSAHGLDEGFRDLVKVNASRGVFEAAQEAKGDFTQTERMRRTAADSTVVEYSREMQNPQLSQTLQSFVFTKIYPMRRTEAQELKFTRSIATQRLDLIAKPLPATLDEYRARGMADVITNLEHQYRGMASAYSYVLGHEVNAAELVTDAELRAI